MAPNSTMVNYAPANYLDAKLFRGLNCRPCSLHCPSRRAWILIACYFRPVFYLSGFRDLVMIKWMTMMIPTRRQGSSLWPNLKWFFHNNNNNFVHLGSKIFKLPDPDSGSRLPPLTINTSGHLNHMSLFLPPFPGASVQNALGNNGSIRDFSWSRPNHPQFSQYPVESPQATTSSSSQDSQDLSSILESELEFVLEKVQKELQSGNFSPRIQDKLRLINALVSESTTETPISARTTSTCESPSLYSW